MLRYFVSESVARFYGIVLHLMRMYCAMYGTMVSYDEIDMTYVVMFDYTLVPKSSRELSPVCTLCFSAT